MVTNVFSHALIFNTWLTFLHVTTSRLLLFAAHIKDHNGKPCPSLSPVSVDLDGVTRLLYNLQSHKAPGPDGIRPRLLKDTATSYCTYANNNFLANLKQGNFLNDWKTASIAPVVKKSSHVDLLNYKPISFTYSCCKSLEHICIHSSCWLLHHLQRPTWFQKTAFLWNKVM